LQLAGPAPCQTVLQNKYISTEILKDYI